MTTLQVSNYFLSTSLKPRAAKERIRESIFEFIEQSDIEDGFNIDLFIEDLVNLEDMQFSLLEEESIDQIDIEVTDEEIDAIIQEYIETNDEGTNLDDDDLDDDGEDEPDFYSDEEDDED